MLDFLGGLIGSGTRLLGGIFGQNSQENIAQENIANQRAFAQNRIQWTVDDAKAAGINPLAALGNATQSYSNVVGSNALGDSIGDSGQNLGRAVAAMAPVKLRNAELENKLLEAKIRNFDSDTVANMKKDSDIATRLGAPGTPPAYPVASPQPPYPTADPRGAVMPLEGRFRDRDGSIVYLPSEKAASPMQTLGALPTNALMALRSAGDYIQPGIDNVVGAARRAASDFNAAVYDRNTTGY